MNTDNSKSNEQHEFSLNLSQSSDLRSSNKHVAVQNLSVYYTWKNTRQQSKNNKHKIIAPAWKDEFELPDSSYSVSDNQDFIKDVIKRHETLPINHPIYIYINRINKD